MNTEWLLSLGNQSLHLILFMTEQCNFRCRYCYETFKLREIAPEVLAGVQNLIERRRGELEVLTINYFGGEPLLNTRAILSFSNWCQTICAGVDQEGTGKLYTEIPYTGSLTTNGYLLRPQTFQQLVAAGVREYQITLDGGAKSHDQLRFTTGGKPTFQTILGNLQAMLVSELAFSCTVRLNVWDGNLDSCAAFLESEGKAFLGDSRFRVHFHPIFGEESLALNDLAGLRDLESLVRSLGGRVEGDVDPMGLLPESAEQGFLGRAESFVCYAARGDSYVIRADGRVQKCTVALEHPQNTIGRIDASGALQLEQEMAKAWVFAANKSCPKISVAAEG